MTLQAACRLDGIDPDIFYDVDIPDNMSGIQGQAYNARVNGERETRAQLICTTCPLQAECLAVGMDEELGVWGGTTQSERKILRSEGGRIRQLSHRPVDSPRRDEIVALFASGLTAEEVAQSVSSQNGGMLQRSSVLNYIKSYIYDEQAYYLEGLI